MDRYNAMGKEFCINEEVMCVADDGEYVWYDDAKDALDAKDAEIKVLRDLVAKEEVCAWEWDEGYYETDCHNAFCFTSDGPIENGMKFCPYCGKRLVEIKPVPGEEEDEE